MFAREFVDIFQFLTQSDLQKKIETYAYPFKKRKNRPKSLTQATKSAYKAHVHCTIYSHNIETKCDKVRIKKFIHEFLASSFNTSTLEINLPSLKTEFSAESLLKKIRRGFIHNKQILLLN